MAKWLTRLLAWLLPATPDADSPRQRIARDYRSFFGPGHDRTGDA